jgi:hypothetical protein
MSEDRLAFGPKLSLQKKRLNRRSLVYNFSGQGAEIGIRVEAEAGARSYRNQELKAEILADRPRELK